jgi:hypothetical protein
MNTKYEKTITICAVLMTIVSTALLIKVNMMQHKIIQYQLKKIESQEK